VDGAASGRPRKTSLSACHACSALGRWRVGPHFFTVQVVGVVKTRRKTCMSEQESQIQEEGVQLAISNTFSNPALATHADNLLNPKGSVIGLPFETYSSLSNQELLELLDWEEITDTGLHWMLRGCTYYKAYAGEVFSTVHKACQSVLSAVVEHGQNVTLSYNRVTDEYVAHSTQCVDAMSYEEYLYLGVGPNNHGPASDGVPIVYMINAGTPFKKQSSSTVDDISEQLAKINCVMTSPITAAG